jgi:alkanesulfonate monooxygenase SsuD/methylene tetrahydromethanopterin reductase-like flavin-dependent oxidoreductase (luciferase family)
VRHAIYLPPFGELADPQVLIELAERAEDRGWDGMFLWDHILRRPNDPQEIADTWIALASIATRTERIRLGPTVTPTARRRPQVIAKAATTLDHLSGGRLTLGLGLGVDTAGELSRFGEVVDPVGRGDALDEAAQLITELWSGEEVHHVGTHYLADGVRFLPRPVQRPRIPLWFAARGNATRPVRRAAHYDGLFAIDVDIEGLTRMVKIVEAERGNLNGFDIAALAIPGVDLPAWEARGVTWAMWSFLPGEPLADIRACVEAGPRRVGPG